MSEQNREQASTKAPASGRGPMGGPGGGGPRGLTMRLKNRRILTRP
jgi:hypothetical protein